MKIGDVADRSGLPAKTIRYYEDIGLIRPHRAANGYRDFGHREVHKLAFLARARSFGFTIGDCRALLALYGDRDRASVDVKRLAEEYLVKIDRKIADLDSMRVTLNRLIQRSDGNYRSDSPTLEDPAESIS